MTIHLIGMEGGGRADIPLTYGAAALRDGARLVNPTTGLSGPIAAARTLADDGHLFLFEKEIAINSTPEVALRALPTVIPAFLFDALDPYILPSGMHVATFATFDAFRRWARPMADRLVAAGLYRHAAVIDIWNPRAQAAWVAEAPPEKRTVRIRIARAVVRGDADSAEFDRLVQEPG